MNIINLTPHAITFVNGEGVVIRTIAPSGKLARVSVRTVTDGYIGGIPVTRSAFGQVEGLPAPEDGTIYVVSSLVASRVPDRWDVFIPNESVRDDQGRIVGCRSLGRI